ncbi:MAG: hypothetical protein MHM6MM_003126 [Cercozoa sp. M6MM]
MHTRQLSTKAAALTGLKLDTLLENVVSSPDASLPHEEYAVFWETIRRQPKEAQKVAEVLLRVMFDRLRLLSGVLESKNQEGSPVDETGLGKQALRVQSVMNTVSCVLHWFSLLTHRPKGTVQGAAREEVLRRVARAWCDAQMSSTAPSFFAVSVAANAPSQVQWHSLHEQCLEFCNYLQSVLLRPLSDAPSQRRRVQGLVRTVTSGALLRKTRNDATNHSKTRHLDAVLGGEYAFSFAYLIDCLACGSLTVTAVWRAILSELRTLRPAQLQKRKLSVHAQVPQVTLLALLHLIRETLSYSPPRRLVRDMERMLTPLRVSGYALLTRQLALARTPVSDGGMQVLALMPTPQASLNRAELRALRTVSRMRFLPYAPDVNKLSHGLTLEVVETLRRRVPHFAQLYEETQGDTTEALRRLTRFLQSDGADSESDDIDDGDDDTDTDGDTACTDGDTHDARVKAVEFVSLASDKEFLPPRDIESYDRADGEALLPHVYRHNPRQRRRRYQTVELDMSQLAQADSNTVDLVTAASHVAQTSLSRALHEAIARQTRTQQRPLVRILVTGDDQQLSVLLHALAALEPELLQMQERPEELPLDLAVYVAPLQRGHLASFLARQDDWYNRQVFEPFASSPEFLLPRLDLDLEETTSERLRECVPVLSMTARQERRLLEDYVRSAQQTLPVTVWRIECWRSADQMHERADRDIPFAVHMQVGLVTEAQRFAERAGCSPAEAVRNRHFGFRRIRADVSLLPADLLDKHEFGDAHLERRELRDSNVHLRQLVLSNVPRPSDSSQNAVDPSSPWLHMHAQLCQGAPTGDGHACLASDPKQRVLALTLRCLENEGVYLLADDVMFGPFAAIRVSQWHSLTLPVKTFFSTRE